MGTPDKLLGAIVNCGSLRTERPSRECRRWPRVPFGVRTAILPIAGNKHGAPVAVRIRDLSDHGIGILYPEAMELNQEFVVAVPRKGAEPILMRCQVMHCRKLETNMYLVGAKFLGEQEIARDAVEEETRRLMKALLDK